VSDEKPTGWAPPDPPEAAWPSSEPPPPPPPPEAGAWPPPSGAPAWPAFGGPTWPSTPGPDQWSPTGGTEWRPPEPAKTRWPVVLAIVLGAVVILVGGLVALARSGGGGGSVTGGGGARVDAAFVDDLEEMLDLIDTSERRMIGFQEEAFQILGPEPDLASGAEAVAAAAQDASADLVEIRDDLDGTVTTTGDGAAGLRRIRDTYSTHMVAWIDYLDAIAGSPALVLPDSMDADSYWQDISDTGDDFVDAVWNDLPDDTPAALRDYAEFILERGFIAGENGGELV
jgi:hypothetical protein